MTHSNDTANPLPSSVASAASLQSPPQSPSWLNKRVGRFKLVGFLGEGAMGRVFRVEDTLLQRYAALKVLPSTIRRGGKTVAVERLIREARAAATVEHPNAVNIYEVNESAGVHYIAMELIEGGTLRDLVKANGPLEYTRACMLCADAADALDHAHQRGIIHRDVKPGNLMLTRSGRCKVTDFGLARAEGAGDLSGRLPESVGTPQFLAPEIAAGSPATAQSDIYSLAATLWYMLTGRSPYGPGAPAESLRRHATEPLPDLAALRPDLPAPLVQAIRTALAKSPAERFNSAQQFSRVLRLHTVPVEAEGGSTIVAAQSVVPAAAQPKASRSGRRKILFAFAAVVIVAGGIAAALPAILRAIQHSPASSASSRGNGSPPSTARAAHSDGTAAATTPINLLEGLDLKSAAVRGAWKLENGDLVSDASQPAILEFPEAVPEEYDFVIEFTPYSAVEQLLYKPAGAGVGVSIVPAHPAAFNWCINASGRCGLESVNQRHLAEPENPAAFDYELAIGRRHTSAVHVRATAVRGYLDGKLIFSYPTDYRSLQRINEWTMRANDHLGVGTWGGASRFHKIELIDRTGSGERQ
jgi:hypothetical protein